MARSPDQVLQSLLTYVPSGWAWSTALGSMLANFLSPLAAEISRFEGLAEEQTTEVDPRVAVNLLPDYERVLGPDPLGNIATTVPQRQARAYQRWTQRGGCSIPEVIAAAAAWGETVTVTERVRNCCGVLKCGRRLRSNPAQFVWIVQPTPSLTVQTVIQEMAPAHTAVIFTLPPGYH